MFLKKVCKKFGVYKSFFIPLHREKKRLFPHTAVQTMFNLKKLRNEKDFYDACCCFRSC